MNKLKEKDMKDINDKKLYFYFSIVTVVIGIILAVIAYYSILVVEPEVRELLSKKENINENYKKAYVILKDPQIFARYQHFDSLAPIKAIFKNFDSKLKKNEEFNQNDLVYLQDVLLERRVLGSELTRNTMIFFFLLSIMGWLFYFSEFRKKSVNNAK